MTKLSCTPLDVGVDVAKDAVVVAHFGASATHPVANQRTTLRAWLKTLPAGSRLGVESTGGYQALLAELAHAQGFTVFVLNPKDVRHYAKGVGLRGKTDRVDARLIARYIAHEGNHLHPWRPPTPARRQLDALLKRRAKLVAVRGALRQTMQHVLGLTAQTKTALAAIETLLAALDRHVAARLKRLPRGAEEVARLREIPGIGPLSGVALVNLFGRIAFANVDAAIAYTGFDPRPCDSGQKRGRRRLSKRGPGELRRLLFNAAMAAAKTKTWKPHYDLARAKGLPTTAALVVLARKLVRVAFSLFKNSATFNPEKLKIV